MTVTELTYRHTPIDRLGHTGARAVMSVWAGVEAGKTDCGCQGALGNLFPSRVVDNRDSKDSGEHGNLKVVRLPRPWGHSKKGYFKPARNLTVTAAPNRYILHCNGYKHSQRRLFSEYKEPNRRKRFAAKPNLHDNCQRRYTCPTVTWT